jgi:dTDP-L-rhamnose 4-epimerase
MGKRILITGGAGFIGSHLADDLLAAGHSVVVYDNLSSQVHGPDAGRPDYLAEEVELVVGDVRDERRLRKALEKADVVFHLAAVVGVGQSMYQVARYTDVNNLGTAVVMEALSRRPVEKLIVASSMSIYGEGACRDQDGQVVAAPERALAQLKRGEWELSDDQGRPLTPIPTGEEKACTLSSVYALSKFDTERLAFIVGRAYGIPTVAMRFFNVYGPRQALSNPYTGVLAIFAARLLNDHAPLINEDGQQRRDFVNVHDVARACRLAMEAPAADGLAFNIGSGRSFRILEVAQRLADALGKTDVEPQITGRYRVGDIRHCFPEIARARAILGYEPQVGFDAGLAELSSWLERQVAVDRVESARAELEVRGLAL